MRISQIPTKDALETMGTRRKQYEDIGFDVYEYNSQLFFISDEDVVFPLNLESDQRVIN